ncbi:MAG: Transcriptional regulatory protein TcrA [Chroococcopsis gigantea SAG 12.99]|jgi:DNA-binding response OmpR family regulator|nr:response regulator transcription factor [Chlorogloea purpurea SAG 13.99]MDV3002350.1 Transcriptional regulatory protein TcrA [Chroococcopsis gigantea SAG 12.99]
MRVLLIEDEADLGMAIKNILIQEKYIVDWVQDGQEALDCLNLHWMQYTIAVVDWMLPSLSGLEICQIIRRNGSYIPILMLTAKERMEDKIQGLDAGADDFLVKPFNVEELLARLRALTRRSPQYQPQKLQVGKLILDYGNYSVSTENSLEIALTTKEFQLLEYLMKHPNQIMTTEQIRNQLWELDSESVSNVVAAQMRLLRRKLAILTSVSLIETIYGVGYRFNNARQ